MKHQIDQVIKRVVSFILMLALMLQSMPPSFAVKSWLDKADIKPLIENPIDISANERVSMTRSKQELSSIFKVEKDKTGNVQSIIYENSERPTYDELLSLFGDKIVNIVNKEPSEEKYISEVSNALAKKYDLTTSQIQEAISLHEDVTALNQAFHGLDLTKEKSSVLPKTTEQVAKLIAGGYSNSQASAAVVTCNILGLDLDALLLAKKTEIKEKEEEAELEEKVSVQVPSKNADLAKKLGIPVSVLDEYLKSNTINEDTLEQQYIQKAMELFPLKETTEVATSRAATDDSYAPEEKIGLPLTYESNSDFNVTLNSGEYTYTETDLSIPGINGLDLELKRQFNSSMSSTGTPYGKYDFDVMFKDVFCVNYRAYEYSRLLEGEFQPVRLRERYDLEEYSSFDVSIPIQDRWYATDQYNDALIDLLSAPSATVMAIGPDGVQVLLYLCPVLDAVSPFFEMACKNRIRDYSYTVDEYGLGVGWRFNLPSIEKYRSRSFTGDYDIIGDDSNFERRLILPNGERYTIDFDGDEYSNLSGYTLENMRIHNNGRGYSGASYTLEYQNGTSYYFDRDGKILAITDAYDNEISFEYPTQDETEFVITDTVGNEIRYENVSPSSTQNYEGRPGGSWRYNVAYTLSLNGNVIQSYYAYDDATDDVRYLKFSVDAAGEIIQYDSSTMDLEFNSFVDNRQQYTNNMNISWVCLQEVDNPDGSIISLLQSNNDRSIGVCGYQTYPCIRYFSTQTDTDSSVGQQVVSRRNYWFDDYTNINTHGTTQSYSTETQDVYCQKVNGTQYRFEKTGTVYEFDAGHDLRIETLECFKPLQYDSLTSASDVSAWQDSNTSYVHKISKYTYNEDHLPIYVDTETYNKNQVAAPIQCYDYEYNQYGQILSKKSPNDQLVQYDYDDRYGQMTRVRYKQNADNTIIVRNTLTGDGKKVSQSITSLGGNTQGKVEYSYDSYGNLVNEKKYRTETDYNETQYSYAKNAWLSETKILNVKNEDGTSVSGTPGYGAGVIAEKTTYNDRGWPISKMDGNGNATTLEYDTIGRVTKTKAADGTSTQYVYDTAASQVTITDPIGTVTKNTYDPFGNLIESYDVTSSVILSQNTYWDNQLVKSVIPSSYGKAQTQYYNYDTLGRNIETGKLDEKGHVIYCETIAYDDGAATMTKIVEGDDHSPAQKEVTYYDEMGQIADTRYYYEDDWVENSYLYDFAGNVTDEILRYSKDGGISTRNFYTYDAFGNVLSQTDSLDNVIKKTYDLSGNMLSLRDAKGNVTHYSYDTVNRLVKVEQPFDLTGNAVTTYQYDGAGNVLRQENRRSSSDEENRVVEYEYDKKNQVILAAMYAPEPNYTQYFYDDVGNLLRVYTGLNAKLSINGLDSVSGSDTDYAVTKYRYDGRSHMVVMTDALGQSEFYAYDTNGQVCNKEDRNGNSITYLYNEMGLPVTTQVQDVNGNIQDTLTYTYTKTGAIKTQSNGDHTTEYFYDAFGRVIEEITDEQTIYNSYDTMGNRTDFSFYHGTEEISSLGYDYNENGWMTSVSGNGISASYAYDANGNLISTTYGNGNTASYTYNAANYPTSVVNRNGNTTISGFNYSYMLDGNVASKTDHTGKMTEYTYDGMNRLTEEIQKKGGALVQSYAYTFDDFNNRSTLTAAGADDYTVAYSYDKNNRLLENTKTSTDETEKTLYFYDPNGNQIGRSMETSANSQDAENISATDTVAFYEKSCYNGFNQMVSTKVDGQDIRYSYAPSGLRLSKSIGQTTIDYALDGDFVAAELNGDTVTACYNRGLELIGSTIGDTTSYYLYNAHGDVVNLTNTSGAATKSYEYDAFGNEVNPSADDTNPFRYCSEYFDAETGRIYLRARYYDPVLGRMLAEDMNWDSKNRIFNQDDEIDSNSIIQSSNIYSYCTNNPIIYVDPEGLAVLPYWGYIHDMVQRHIRYKHPTYYTEEWIKYDDSVFPGRADVISPEGYVWEVKTARAVADPDRFRAAIKQINRYVDNTWIRMPDVDLKHGDNSLSGSFIARTRYVNYNVSYKGVGNGIIAYEYTYEFVKEQVLQDTITIGGIATEIYFATATGGASVLIPVP